MTDTLAALVGSRICHDLISPLGAIGNGVELLSLTDGDTSAEMALISESVENANARIRFVRIAYGAASAEQSVSRAEVLSILAACARGGRFNYMWQVDEDQPRRDVRTAFLLLQCIEHALPLGGDLTVTKTDSGWSVSGTGKRIEQDPDLWATLHSDDTSQFENPAQVQFALLPRVLAESGRALDVGFSADAVRAHF